MPSHRLRRRAMLAAIGAGWKRVKSDPTKAWYQSMKSLTARLNRVSGCRLPGWGPREYCNQWL
uniref:SJCHGC03132 protein n=1 Tax=Schistosoma japonicum TaxID=6182 RepID=Q3MJV6_SCHJA|nr:SJCHGC03132 protein [Schistosoma japonicum]